MRGAPRRARPGARPWSPTAGDLPFLDGLLAVLLFAMPPGVHQPAPKLSDPDASASEPMLALRKAPRSVSVHVARNTRDRSGHRASGSLCSATARYHVDEHYSSCFAPPSNRATLTRLCCSRRTLNGSPRSSASRRTGATGARCVKPTNQRRDDHLVAAGPALIDQLRRLTRELAEYAQAQRHDLSSRSSCTRRCSPVPPPLHSNELHHDFTILGIAARERM